MNRADLNDKKILFAASTGGHLAQLVRLAPRMNPSEDSVWITFDTPQSRSLLEGRNVVHVPYINSRDGLGVVRAAKIVKSVLTEQEFDLAVSTGAGLALAVLPQARMQGVRSTYIESVSRVDGPSLTGRILAATRACDLYTQHPQWASNRWMPHEGVLGSFASTGRNPSEKPKIFVTLGTIGKYRFDSLVEALLHTGIADEDTVWQLGVTKRTDLPGTVHEYMTANQFVEEVTRADVVVTHSGVGTLLQLFDLGVYPVVVPRSKQRSEHVDNHQYQIARLVQEKNLGSVCEPAELSVKVLSQAAGLRVTGADGQGGLVDSHAGANNA